MIAERLWPSGVRVTERPRRSNSLTPWVSSRRLTCAEIVGWLTRPARAALVKPPACATRWKARSPVCDMRIDPIYGNNTKPILDQ